MSVDLKNCSSPLLFLKKESEIDSAVVLAKHALGKSIVFRGNA